MDICLMNQKKLNRFLLSDEKIVKRPPNFPSLPVNTEVQLNDVDNFLTDDSNLSAAVCCCTIIILYYYLYYFMLFDMFVVIVCFNICLLQSIYFAKYVDPLILDNSVRKMLSKIITNILAQNFSFRGRGNKYKFEALKI